MLSPEQRHFYDTFGFLVFRRCYAADEIGEIGRQFDELMAEARHGEPFDHLKRQVVMQYVEKRPALAALLEDDRIYGVIEDLLGPGFVWLPSDGNLYVGNTDWHPDRRDVLPEYSVIKIAFYLDPVGKDSGCLRVIPGSHREPLHSALFPLFKHRADPPEHPFGVPSAEVPAYPLESEPGDVVLFNQCLFHASFGGNDHRRMFTLNFTTRPSQESHVADHRRNYESALKWAQSNPHGAQDHVYDPAFLSGGGPRRQAMLHQIVEWGFR
jgi:Phytanoyl-CoA dioxygenase (PhyH)